jgi:type IV secretory pathway TraG/TraD family ATPase VirD4
VSISLGIQSVNQLKQKYNEEANSILDNLKTKAFLPGLSYDSAEYASKMIGFKEVDSVSTSFSKKQDNSYSVSKQKRELITPDEVRDLDETILIITDNRNPIIDKQDRYYQDKRLLAITQDEMTVEEFFADQIKRQRVIFVSFS